jgi:hypothetical protein
VLPSEISSIESFSPVDVARQCLDVMNDPDLAESNCASLVKQASTFTWEASAIVIRQLMETVLTRPKNPIEAIWSAGPDPQQLRSPQATLVQRVTRRFTPRIRRGPRSSH